MWAHTFALEGQALWKILVAGLVLGSGLPALFAAGVRAQAHAQGGAAETHPAGTAPAAAHPASKLVAALCFAVVLAVVALGILYIVVTGFGHVLSFAHGYPTITSKS